MIVGIGHKQRRGKDTAADALVRELGFTKIGFADALKDLAYHANPLVVPEQGFVNVQVGHNNLSTLVDRYGWEYVKDHYPLVRPFLQRLGQAARTVLGENFWFDAWRKRAEVFNTNLVGPDYPKHLVVSGQPVVVPDVRFRNEAENLKRLGAVLIRIDRTMPTISDSDVSEHDLDDFHGWDAVIQNNGTIADLERQVLDIAKHAEQVDLEGPGAADPAQITLFDPEGVTS